MKFCGNKGFRPEEFAAACHMQHSTSHILRSMFVVDEFDHIEAKHDREHDCIVARNDFGFV